MKQAKSFKEYNKIIRKYFKRYEWWLDKKGKVHNSKFSCKWGIRIWVHYIIDSPEKAIEALHHPKYTRGNLGQILNEYLQDYGKHCRFDYSDSPEGTLYGIELTNEDYYWIIKLPNGQYSYESCVGGYTILE